MTLDAADDDPVRLWTHLATAVERLGEGLAGRALMCLGTISLSVWLDHLLDNSGAEDKNDNREQGGEGENHSR